MPRTAKFVSAVFASALAGALLTPISHNTARAADDCLSGPGAEAPQGSHWYYRIDRATRRQCWYLREEGENRSPMVLPSAPQPEKPVAAKPETATKNPIADARAELPAQTRVEQPRRSDELTPADTAISETGGGAGALRAQVPRSVVASRWPNWSDASPSTNPPPNKRDPVANASPTPRTQPPSVLAAGQFAAADASLGISAYSAQVRLAALAGALMLAAVLGGVVFKLANSRKIWPGKIRARRGPIWEPTDDDAIVLSDHHETHTFSYRGGFARGRAGDRHQRIAQFFAQLSKRAPT